MSTVELKVDDREVNAVLGKVARKVDNAEPLMATLEGDMLDAVEENFRQEGRPKWAKLRPSTIRARQKKGHWPGKILQVKGILAKSIQGRHDGRSAMVGTNDIRARLLHFGGSVDHAARERVLHFKQKTRGTMTHSRPGTGDTFAKAKGSHYAMKVQGKAYRTKHAARPFMTLAAPDLAKMKRHALEYLQQ